VFDDVAHERVYADEDDDIEETAGYQERIVEPPQRADDDGGPVRRPGQPPVGDTEAQAPTPSRSEQSGDQGARDMTAPRATTGDATAVPTVDSDGRGDDRITSGEQVRTVYVTSPVPPRPKGNRGFGILM